MHERPNMKVGVILNLTSGTLSFPENREILLGALRDAGLDTTVVTIENGTEIGPAVRRLLDAACETIVAGGGDGTINAVDPTYAGFVDTNNDFINGIYMIVDN